MSAFVVAVGALALPFVSTANALPTLANCGAWSAGAHHVWSKYQTGNWRRDPPQGGCIVVGQTFLTHWFGYAQIRAAHNAAARRKLDGIDLSWWPLRLDGDFGTQTTKAIKAYRKFENVGSDGAMDAGVLMHMVSKCHYARRYYGYQTAACHRPGGPN